MEIKEALDYWEQKYDQLKVHDAHKFLLKEYAEEYDRYVQNVEFVISLIKKQIPQKPIRIDVSGKRDGNWEERCPVCEKLFVKRITTEEYSKPYIFYRAPYCTCGQKIDWPE